MPEGCRIGIVAALEREVRPLIKDWPVSRREYSGRPYKFFAKQDLVVVCGGIGSEAARRAAEAVISLYHPVLLVSAGFAGALDPALRAGHVLSPRLVIDAADGSRTDAGGSDGVLLTFGTVADAGQKARLAKAYGVQAVDMEAAAVARAAQARGVKFAACKVISDAADSQLPPMARFVGKDGTFHYIKFLIFVAVRPWLWVSVVKLARDSAIAADILSETLAETKVDAAVEGEVESPIGRGH